MDARLQVYESQTRGDNRALVQRVTRLLGSGRAGLVTDVDGTISPMVARPDEAIVLPRARTALAALRDVLELVAVVSGRGAADARRLVALDGLVYIGNHGFEVWTGTAPGDGPAEGQVELLAEAGAWVPRLAAAVSDIERQLPQPGVLIENKGATASLHYRLAAEPERVRLELLRLLARQATTSDLRIVEGRMVINLLPPLDVTKGSAVTWLIRHYKLNSLVYLGDDITDTHAFSALAGLRQAGEAQTLGIAVVGPETPPSVRQLADASLPSAAAVAGLLGAVADRLREDGRASARMA